MFDIGRKQYVFKQSTGKIVRIFFRQNEGICLDILGKTSINNEPALSFGINLQDSWLEHTVLKKDALNRFSACMDHNDNFHILCHDRSTYFLHIACRETGTPRIVYSSEIHSGHILLTRIESVEKELYYIYLLQQYGEFYLFFQISKETLPSSQPLMLDRILPEKSPFYTVKDRENNLYLFYKKADSKKIGFKKYITAKAEWTDFHPINEFDRKCELLYSIADDQNNIHLCCQKLNNNSFDLLYSKLQPGFDCWEHIKVLARNSFSFHNGSLFSVDSRIIAFWIREQNIVYCVSPDHGQVWSKAECYPSAQDTPLDCVIYVTNMQGEFSGAHWHELPGNLSSGCTLALLDRFTAKPENMAFEQLQQRTSNVFRMSFLQLKELADSIHELEKELEKTANKLEHLRQRQDSIEKQLSDFTEKIDIIDELEAGSNKHNKQEVEEINDKINKKTPLMPGVGFVNITLEYLKNLRKNK